MVEINQQNERRRRCKSLLEIHWPRLIERLPGYIVGTLGAFWTIQRVAMLLRGVA